MVCFKKKRRPGFVSRKRRNTILVLFQWFVSEEPLKEKKFFSCSAVQAEKRRPGFVFLFQEWFVSRTRRKEERTGVLLFKKATNKKPGFVFLFQENKVLFVCFKNNKGCRSSSEEPLAEEPLNGAVR